MLHCHVEHHMANGMMTLVQYEGAVPTGPAAAFFDPVGASSPSTTGHQDHGGAAAPPPTEEPATPATPEAPDTAAVAAPPAATVEIAMVDDRFEPNYVEVLAGTTVIWVNKGGNWHSVAAFDGSFESKKLANGESFSVLLDTPGLYQYICKHHGMQGMMGRVVVT